MLDAKSLFSESYYKTEYPEVAKAVASGAFSNGFDHFNKFGKFEGRDPGPFYDDSFYLSQNPGVAQAVRTGAMSSGFDHFILYGQKEGRNASVLYDDTYYLSHQTDVAAAVKSSKDSLTGEQLTGIEQYVKTGLSEGRAGSIEFDPSYYVQNSPGLKAAKFTNQQAAEHFAIYGINEGRQASSSFDVQYYLNNSPDLKAAKLTYRQAAEQFITAGYKEQRLSKAGIVPAGSTGGKITVGVNILSSSITQNALQSVGGSLQTTQVAPNFTDPSVIGQTSTTYPFNFVNEKIPNTPWTDSNRNVFVTVLNNSNYATTKFNLSINSNRSDLAPAEFDLANSTSDIFGKITYDASANAITFETADKKGIPPGSYYNLFLRYTVPQELINKGSQNLNTITFTPVSSEATTVNVKNQEFQNPDLEPGQVTDQLNSQGLNITPPVPGWDLYDPNGLLANASPGNLAIAGVSNALPYSQYSLNVPKTGNVAFVSLPNSSNGKGVAGLSQTLTTPLAANTNYDLRVDVSNLQSFTANGSDGKPFNVDNSGFPGYRVELLAGGNVIAADNNSVSIKEGDIGRSVVSYQATANDPNLGKPLQIRLINLNANQGKGSELDFDNVVLTATPVS